MNTVLLSEQALENIVYTLTELIDGITNQSATAARELVRSISFLTISKRIAEKPCEDCGSIHRERLPWADDFQRYIIYTCRECGSSWARVMLCSRIINTILHDAIELRRRIRQLDALNQPVTAGFEILDDHNFLVRSSFVQSFHDGKIRLTNQSGKQRQLPFLDYDE